MNRNLNKIPATAVFIAIFFIASAITEAQERLTLSARAGAGAGVSFRQASSGFRVSDNGRPRKLWRQQVVYRATNDTFVYRGEGRATVRDEFSSPVMIFHTTRKSGIRGGHVFQNRDN